MPSLLFICLGNICRSPLAEGALRQAARQQGLALRLDSAGTGHWHIGRPPDPRAIAAARRNGMDISDLRARQVTADDFTRFDHILALDPQNLADWRRQAPPPASPCCWITSRGARVRASPTPTPAPPPTSTPPGPTSRPPCRG
jgi:protein-tyrosine phosphatase